MGSITSVNSRPRTWPVRESTARLKPEYGDEPLVMVQYGSYDEYPEAAIPMSMLMRKSIYDKCLSGAYRVDTACTDTLRLLCKNVPVPPLCEDVVY